MAENNDSRTMRLKKMLLDRKRKMWNDLRDEFFRKLGKEYNAQFDNPHDLEELSVIDLIEDVGIGINEIRKEELLRIDDALRRLDDGTYGVCEECGARIEEERLRLLPWATFCANCSGRKDPASRAEDDRRSKI